MHFAQIEVLNGHSFLPSFSPSLVRTQFCSLAPQTQWSVPSSHLCTFPWWVNSLEWVQDLKCLLWTPSPSKTEMVGSLPSFLRSCSCPLPEQHCSYSSHWGYSWNGSQWDDLDPVILPWLLVDASPQAERKTLMLEWVLFRWVRIPPWRLGSGRLWSLVQ